MVEVVVRATVVEGDVEVTVVEGDVEVTVVEGDVVVAVVCGATVTPLLRTNLPPDLTHVYLLPAITNCFPRVVQGVPASDDLSAETGIATDSQESVSSPISTRFITELYYDIDSSMTANVTEIHRIGGAPGKNRTCDLRFRKPSLYPTELRELDSLRLSASTVSVRGWQTDVCG